MFPFFEPNLFPLLEGGRLIFYIFLRKGKALLWAFAACCRAFLRLWLFCITASFYAICEPAIGVPLAAACLTRSSNICGL